MSVLTQTRRKSFPWTGIETSFSLGFPASRVEDITVTYVAAGGTRTVLQRGVHFTASLSGQKLVTLTPSALPTPPGTLEAVRSTPALVPEVLQDGQDFPASVHQDMHDRAAMRDAELLEDTALALRLDTLSGEYAAGGRAIGGLADPTEPDHAATLAWVLDQLEGFPAAAAIAATALAGAQAAAVSAAANAAIIQGLLNMPLDMGSQSEPLGQTYDLGVQGT